jgi:hypothetical protein
LERLRLGSQDFRLDPAGGAAECARDGVWSIQTGFRRRIRAEEPKNTGTRMNAVLRAYVEAQKRQIGGPRMASM